MYQCQLSFHSCTWQGPPFVWQKCDRSVTWELGVNSGRNELLMTHEHSWATHECSYESNTFAFQLPLPLRFKCMCAPIYMTVLMSCWCHAEVMPRSCWGHFRHKNAHGAYQGYIFCTESNPIMTSAWHQRDISVTSAWHQHDIIGKGHRHWTNCGEHSPQTSISGRENCCWNTWTHVQGESCFRHSLSHQSHTFAFQPPLPPTKMPTPELISPKTIFSSMFCPPLAHKCTREPTKGTFLCRRWPQGNLSVKQKDNNRKTTGTQQENSRKTPERAQKMDQLSGTFAPNINSGAWKWGLEHIKTGSGRIVFSALPLTRKRYFCLPATPASDQKANPRTDLPQNYICINLLPHTNPRKPS